MYHTLGPGFRDWFCQRALAFELPAHNLEFSREVWIDVHYKDRKVGRYRVDFVVDEVMVEIKAKSTLDAVDFAQTLSYLRASGYKVGLLLNLGGRKLILYQGEDDESCHCERSEAIPICQVETACLAQEEIASSLTLLAMTYLTTMLKRYWRSGAWRIRNTGNLDQCPQCPSVFQCFSVSVLQ